MHALAMGNIYITFGFVTIATSQFAIGMWATFYFSGMEPGKGSHFLVLEGQLSFTASALSLGNHASIAITVPEILSPDAFHLCGPHEQRTLEVIYTGLSLLYGTR